jgi:hypothetical protein
MKEVRPHDTIILDSIRGRIVTYRFQDGIEAFVPNNTALADATGNLRPARFIHQSLYSLNPVKRIHRMRVKLRNGTFKVREYRRDFIGRCFEVLAPFEL